MHSAPEVKERFAHGPDSECGVLRPANKQLRDGEDAVQNLEPDRKRARVEEEAVDVPRSKHYVLPTSPPVPTWDPLANMSPQQGALLDKMEEGYNILLEALPGCGKSTFICQMAAAFPDSNLVVISYNNALVKTTNALLESIVQRQASCGFAQCKTYHGLLQSLTEQTTKDDILYGKVLFANDFRARARKWPFRDFDKLIIDETQDQRRPYFRLIIELLGSLHPHPERVQICALGDAWQLIYSFFAVNKADARYLTCADQIYSHRLNPRPWHKATLDVSFRATDPIAHFLNVLVPERKMVSAMPCRITDWVTMYVCDVYRDAANIVYDIVKRERQEHALHDIVILAPSLNEHSPVRRVVDLLVSNDIPVHVDRSGKLTASQVASEDTIRKNKVAARTNPSSKGLTYKVVIAINPTELKSRDSMVRSKYVSLSRANTRLYLLQSAFYTDQDELNLLTQHLTQRDLRIILKREVPLKRKKESREERGTILTKNNLDAGSLFAFLDVDHLNKLLEHIESVPLIVGIQEEDEPLEDAVGSAYSRTMTHSFDKGETYSSLLPICSLALQLALEGWFTGTTPVAVKEALFQVRNSEDYKTKLMNQLLLDALDDIDSAFREHVSAERRDKLWTCMPSFAKMAVVLDALAGYREMLHFVTTFDFVSNDLVKQRFYALCENLEYLLSDAVDLSWNKEHVARFVHEQQPLQLCVRASVASASRSHVVHFSTGLVTSYEDRLVALTTALALRTTGRLSDSKIYVVNLTDTSVEQVSLKTSDEQLHVPDPELLQELGEEAANLLPRRLTCPFLTEAVTYKLLPRDDDEATTVQSTQDFLAQAYKDIDDVLDASKTDTNSTMPTMPTLPTTPQPDTFHVKWDSAPVFCEEDD